MPEGIRIRPRPGVTIPDDAMMIVRDQSRRINPADGHIESLPQCSICGDRHDCRAYHIQLRAGTAIVSAGVWGGLTALVDNPFEYVNPVPDPPTISIRPGHETRLIEKWVPPIGGSYGNNRIQ